LQGGTKYSSKPKFLQSLKQSVKLKEGADFNDWLAYHMEYFRYQISLLYGIIEEYCTSSCKIMTAGPRFQYFWKDDNSDKPIKVSACDYFRLLMDWIGALQEDEAVFPSNTQMPYPANFPEIIKPIFRRLFRVYAHLYYSHWSKLTSFVTESQLDGSMMHFYFFCHEFKLIDEDEFEPLQMLIEQLNATLRHGDLDNHRKASHRK